MLFYTEKVEAVRGRTGQSCAVWGSKCKNLWAKHFFYFILITYKNLSMRGLIPFFYHHTQFSGTPKTPLSLQKMQSWWYFWNSGGEGRILIATTFSVLRILSDLLVAERMWRPVAFFVWATATVAGGIGVLVCLLKRTLMCLSRTVHMQPTLVYFFRNF